MLYLNGLTPRQITIERRTGRWKKVVPIAFGFAWLGLGLGQTQLFPERYVENVSVALSDGFLRQPIALEGQIVAA